MGDYRLSSTSDEHDHEHKDCQSPTHFRPAGPEETYRSTILIIKRNRTVQLKPEDSGPGSSEHDFPLEEPNGKGVHDLRSNARFHPLENEV